MITYIYLPLKSESFNNFEFSTDSKSSNSIYAKPIILNK